MEQVRILLVDDHAILRAGLRLLIENQTDFSVVGEADSGQRAITLVKQLQPDVVLLDINMPDMDGISVLPSIKEIAPGCKVLILTMHDDAQYLRETLDLGAVGYVLKRAVDTELILAIRAVVRGEKYIHSAMTQKLINQFDETSLDESTMNNPWHHLSEREHETLKLVAYGHTNAEIAEKLFVSVKTVETYRARGMEKLNLETRAQLVKSALKNNILE